FEQFLALCAEAGPESCALAALGDPSEVVEDTLAALKEQPLEVPLPDGSTAELGYDEVVAAVFSSLYVPAGWSDLAALLAEIAVMADTQEQEPQTMSAQSLPSIGELLRRLGLIEDYPSIGGALASMCGDAAHPLGPWDYAALGVRADAEAPRCGPSRARVGIQCDVGELPDEDAYAGPWEQQTGATVLVIRPRYAPATPSAFTPPYADRYPD